MKIIKSGEVIAEMRDKPRDFASRIKNGTLWVEIGDEDIKLAHYADNDRAREVSTALYNAYRAGEPEFVLPEE